MISPTPLELLGLARDIAAEAGALAAEMRAGGISVHTTKSTPLDIVTQADTAVEALIRERIGQARPDDGFLGEESGESDSVSGITWIVDPIDGTVNYLYGSSYYAVSIAVTARDDSGLRTALAGVVHAPALGAEYSAAAGYPAYLNDAPLQSNAGVPLERALVSTGIPYALPQRTRVLRDMSALVPHVRDLRLVGAAALEICGVAEGRTDAHFQRGLPSWDYAAAALIASQAGAAVMGAGGRPGTDDLLVIGDLPLCEDIRACIG